MEHSVSSALVSLCSHEETGAVSREACNAHSFTLKCVDDGIVTDDTITHDSFNINVSRLESSVLVRCIFSEYCSLYLKLLVILQVV